MRLRAVARSSLPTGRRQRRRSPVSPFAQRVCFFFFAREFSFRFSFLIYFLEERASSRSRGFIPDCPEAGRREPTEPSRGSRPRGATLGWEIGWPVRHAGKGQLASELRADTTRSRHADLLLRRSWNLPCAVDFFFGENWDFRHVMTLIRVCKTLFNRKWIF